MGEIGHQAEPFELALLHLDPFRGIVAAFLAELGARHVVLVALLLAVLFLDLPFDGQAVAVPAGHEGRVLAHHALRAHHHVLEDAVQRVADMHVAIGVGRAVMQDEFFRAPPRLAQLVVEVLVLPARQNARLLLREAGFHGKIGLRQEDGVAVIARAGIGFGHRVAPLTHKGRVGKGFEAWAGRRRGRYRFHAESAEGRETRRNGLSRRLRRSSEDEARLRRDYDTPASLMSSTLSARNELYASSLRASSQSLAICSVNSSSVSNFASPRRK